MMDHLFMARARKISEQSPDRSRKVGCVIVTRHERIASEGFNDFPRGVEGKEERHQRPEKYLWTEHAERNAIYNAARRGISLSGCRAYLPWFPCMDCARALVQVGIEEVIATEPDLSDPKWGEDFKRVGTLFEEAGVKVRFICD